MKDAVSFKTTEFTYALCRYIDAPDVWFNAAETELAQQICAQCFHKAECAALAIRGREAYGVWGGTTPTQRVAISRRKRKAEKGTE